MNLNNLGLMIREGRVLKQLSQEQLSEKAGVSIKSLHSIELGKANPSIMLLSSILNALDLELVVLQKRNK